MSIIEPAIRPPSEAQSFLLQITTGCSSNTCSFCGAYLNKPFMVKGVEEVYSDIDSAKEQCPDIRRVFLMDGDALAVNNKKILPVLKKLSDAFPRLSRIASYANGYNIVDRTEQELKELSENKLTLIYMGLESGSQDILDHCKKRSTVKEMVEAVRKAEASGIKSSVIVLLGLGGKKNTKEHVRDTISALNEMQPRYLSFLSLMVIPGTPLAVELKSKGFQELDQKELLTEAHDIIEGIELSRTIFRSNHASNYLSLEGRFPNDKERLLSMLKAALDGKMSLRPEFLRGL